MNTEAVISVIVFLLVMAAIISEKMHRAVAAMAGAVILFRDSCRFSLLR